MTPDAAVRVEVADRADCLRATIEVWQHFSAVPLTEEDARQILYNMTGFFNLLISWEAAAAAQSQADEDLDAAA